MSKRLFAGCVACLLACAASPSGGEVRGTDEPLPSAIDEAWAPVWSDEFDGDGPVDEHKWVVFEGDRHHEGVLSASARAAVTRASGALRVSAIETPSDPKFPYATGYISTNGTFAQTYGKIEVRLRGPHAPGLWYAVWGRPWGDHAVPELDIELLGKDASQVWFVNHWALPPLPAADRRRFTTVDGVDFTSWHVYTILWTPTRVEWLVDGQVYMKADDADPSERRGIPREPLFWTINGWVGGWAGPPRPPTTFPAAFEVDFFRVYRPDPWMTDPAVRVLNPRETVSTDETLDLAVADLDAGARIEVWEGDARLDTLATPPFRWHPNISKGAHTLRFVATDGARQASTEVALRIE